MSFPLLEAERRLGDGHERSAPENAIVQPYRRAIEMAWQIATFTPRCFEGFSPYRGAAPRASAT